MRRETSTAGVILAVGDRLGKAVIQKILSKQRNSCYVLITCGEPTDEGEMEVELTYEGDHDLAAYLVESAHSLICRDADAEPEEA